MSELALEYLARRGQVSTPLRHFCRNHPHCRDKLKPPTDNSRRAFCCERCHAGFYKTRCIVCEKELPPGRSDRRFCRKPSCRSRYRQNPGLFDFFEPNMGLGTGPADLSQKKSIKSKSKSALETDRAWHFVAATEARNRRLLEEHFDKLDSTAIDYCARCGRDDDLVDYKVDGDRWTTTCCECRTRFSAGQQRVKSGVPDGTPGSAWTAEELARLEDYRGQVPDDLSIPKFLRRVPS
jgi:hypothetical protein